MPTHPASKIEDGLRLMVDEERHLLAAVSPFQLKLGFPVSIHHGVGVVDVDGVENLILWTLSNHGVEVGYSGVILEDG